MNFNKVGLICNAVSVDRTELSQEQYLQNYSQLQAESGVRVDKFYKFVRLQDYDLKCCKQRNKKCPLRDSNPGSPDNANDEREREGYNRINPHVMPSNW